MVLITWGVIDSINKDTEIKIYKILKYYLNFFNILIIKQYLIKVFTFLKVYKSLIYYLLFQGFCLFSFGLINNIHFDFVIILNPNIQEFIQNSSFLNMLCFFYIKHFILFNFLITSFL
jgi:hypothetical protein